MKNEDIKKYIDSFKALCCPICDNFYFSGPKDEIDIKDYEHGVYCPSCGWIYDYNQFLNKDEKNGKNKMSLNEYKSWYNEQLKEDPKFDYYEKFVKKETVSHKCPVCGEYDFDQEMSFDICTVCGWQDDGSENWDDVEIAGPNMLPYKEYKKCFIEKRKINPKYNWLNDCTKNKA